MRAKYDDVEQNYEWCEKSDVHNPRWIFDNRKTTVCPTCITNDFPSDRHYEIYYRIRNTGYSWDIVLTSTMAIDKELCYSKESKGAILYISRHLKGRVEQRTQRSMIELIGDSLRSLASSDVFPTKVVLIKVPVDQNMMCRSCDLPECLNPVEQP
jgi:hypothetical protein